ncbi:hypothetical protein B5807_02078 [Epicoccum nigrum]|uniref:Uncharacterized protein n=1 Tax=Epicoccum nigrum TaxID=105696 RepID=A0A1Y2M8J6_EPING|nr:hypothetical protein B5807_02078 [Epicoccum nigrum]
MYFLPAVRWQRIRRSESRLAVDLIGPERRLPALPAPRVAPRDFKKPSLVCCADTPSGLPLRVLEACIKSNCIEILRRTRSQWRRGARNSKATLAEESDTEKPQDRRW